MSGAERVRIMSIPLATLTLAALPRNRCENATVPSPRTLGCSSKSATAFAHLPLQSHEQWQSLQRTLAGEATAYYQPASGSICHGRRPAPRIVFVGDSITESFRGTSLGKVGGRSAGMERAVELGKLSQHCPLFLGVSGDETQHLLWRLRDGGELTARMRDDEQLVFNLLIGTNNLGNAGHSVEDTAAGVVAVADELLRRTRGLVLVNKLLPRSVNPRHQNPCTASCKQGSHLPLVRRVNALLDESMRKQLKPKYPARVSLHDCGSLFLSDAPGAEVHLHVMPDALHPNLAGQKMWAECLLQGVRQLWQARIGRAAVLQQLWQSARPMHL